MRTSIRTKKLLVFAIVMAVRAFAGSAVAVGQDRVITDRRVMAPETKYDGVAEE